MLDLLLLTLFFNYDMFLNYGKLAIAALGGIQ